MSIRKELLKDIKAQRRASVQQRRFEGTFLDYMELIQENPDIVKTAHKRLYASIVKHGVKNLPEDDSRKQKIFNNESIKIYDYFKEHFFGMETVITKLMHYMKSAAMKGEESRQVLLLMGPVGAGKSALTEHIKQALHGETENHCSLYLGR